MKLLQFLKTYALLLLFSVFLVAVSIVDMCISNRDFSEMENRQLTKRPPMTMRNLLSKEEEQKFSYKYEQYINDQFVGRDFWITAKSISESVLAKIENNGVIYGEEDYQFEKLLAVESWKLERNTKAVLQFAEKHKDQVDIWTGIIPNSYAVLDGLLPAGVPLVDQSAGIAELNRQLEKQTHVLHLEPVMRKASADYAYYRTDHHWTSRGAYAAYRAFAEARGMQPVEWEALAPYRHQADGFLGTYYNKSKLYSAKADMIEYFEPPLTSVEVNGEPKATLNDTEKWNTHSKYAAFLWDNNGLTVLKSENNPNHQLENPSRILLVKDSYGNCFAPFLTYNYDEVYIVDLRFFTGSVEELLKQERFSDLLILYNYKNFAEDMHVPMMK